MLQVQELLTVLFKTNMANVGCNLTKMGFPLFHWLAANITRNELKDNESQIAGDFIQGCNSWTSIQGKQQSKELSCFYGGMTPPDKEHIYELYHEMDGHILDSFILKGIYKS